MTLALHNEEADRERQFYDVEAPILKSGDVYARYESESARDDLNVNMPDAEGLLSAFTAGLIEEDMTIELRHVPE